MSGIDGNLEHLEREVKLDVWLGFAFPDLDDLGDLSELGGGVEVGPPVTRRLRATYYDTADLRLVRSGITVRHRLGDGTGWTVKLPADGNGDGAVVRAERTFKGKAGAVPSAVDDVVVAWRRGAPLAVVARFDTERRVRVVTGPGGAVLAEVVDDEVSVYEGDHLAMRFREIEVEQGSADGSSAVAALVDRLVGAGAGRSTHPSKLARALGPRASAPGDLDVAPLGERPSAGDVLRAGLARSATLVVAHDAGVRAGVDVEAVHQARVGTRRLRSDLQAFGPLLLPAWAADLRRELSWLADALGDVRDADVLLARLDRRVESLDAGERGAGGLLVERLRAERADAVARLAAVLDDERYVALLDRLIDAVHDPAVTKEACRPAAKVLGRLAAEPWHRLRSAVADLGDDPTDDELHRVRIRAKRVRYAAELASLSAGKGARRFAKAVAALQDVLGGRNDAIVTEEWLRRAAAEVPPAPAALALRLAEVERASVEAADLDWAESWQAVTAKGLRSWMRS